MRFQGKITSWNDSKGFGFITLNGTDKQVFVHISAFSKGSPRPKGGELVNYETVDNHPKGPQASNVTFVNMTNTRAKKPFELGMRAFIVLMMLVTIGLLAWRSLVTTPPLTQPDSSINSYIDAVPTFGKSFQHFECSGKQKCSEMTSCEEATFYLKNCPNAEMDGDGDGIPCESQWCN